jgi:peptide/nickel transport system substrate-binding protein
MPRWRPLPFVMGLVLLLAACGSPGTSPSATQGSGSAAPGGEEQPKDGGTMVVALPGEIDNLDPALISDSNSSYVMNQVMEGLVGLAPGSISDIVPVLASELPTVSDDGLTYTFKLREGVKFHDGTDFNAEAVKANYERWVNLPKNLQANAYYFGAVFGGFGKGANIDSVTPNGDFEVAIKLRRPQSNFLISQTLTPFFMSSPSALEENDASNPDIKKNAYAQTAGMVGTGPFKFSEWVSGDHVTIEKNPDYWNPEGVAHLDEIVFRPFADQTAEYNALAAGDVDLAQTVAPVDAETASSDPNLQIIDRGESCNIANLAMNDTKAPFDNKDIRMAVAYAVNKQSYIDAFYAGQAVPADNWMPPATQFYKPLNLPTYDPDKAKELIASSGVANPTIDFWYPSDVARPYMPDPKGLFEAIQRDLEAVGFTVNPHTATWNPDYLDAETVGEYPMWLIGWTCDWAGPDNFITTFFGYHDGKPNPEFGYTNDAVDKAMRDALAATDEAEQEQLWGEAQDGLAADLPTVPLVHSTPPLAAQAYVKDVVGSGALNEYFNTAWLDK